MNYKWKLPIKYCPFESEEQRNRAYKRWVRLFLKAEARKREMKQKARVTKTLREI